MLGSLSSSHGHDSLGSAGGDAQLSLQIPRWRPGHGIRGLTPRRGAYVMLSVFRARAHSQPQTCEGCRVGWWRRLSNEGRPYSGQITGQVREWVRRAFRRLLTPLQPPGHMRRTTACWGQGHPTAAWGEAMEAREATAYAYAGARGLRLGAGGSASDLRWQAVGWSPLCVGSESQLNTDHLAGWPAAWLIELWRALSFPPAARCMSTPLDLEWHCVERRT